MKIFTERQSLMKWVKYLVLGSFVLVLGVVGSVFFAAEGVNEEPAVIVIMIVSLVVAALAPLLIFSMRLETEIDHNAISIRVFPFRTKEIKWDDIQTAYIRPYSPIMEYGGWGIRYSFRNGRAYNMSGKIGLQLILTNGKKILIGTQQGDKLSRVLEQNFEDKTTPPLP